MTRIHEKTSDGSNNNIENTSRFMTEAAEKTRDYLEKSMRLMQDEFTELVNRRLDHNGATLNECQQCKDLSALISAQHKWFENFNRDYLDSWMHFNEAAQKLFADGLMQANGLAKEVQSHPLGAEAAEHRAAAE